MREGVEHKQGEPGGCTLFQLSRVVVVCNNAVEIGALGVTFR